MKNAVETVQNLVDKLKIAEDKLDLISMLIKAESVKEGKLSDAAQPKKKRKYKKRVKAEAAAAQSDDSDYKFEHEHEKVEETKDSPSQPKRGRGRPSKLAKKELEMATSTNGDHA